MLSHSELRRAARILEERCVNFRVDKVIEAREHRVQLTLYGRSGDDAASSKHHVLLCCAPGTGRVSELSRSEKSPEDLLKFAQYLRPRITGSRLRQVSVHAEERQVRLRFEGGEGIFEILLALMGNRSNLYVLDQAGCIRACQRPLEQTRRSMSIGSPWEDPPPVSGSGREPGEDRWKLASDSDYLFAIERHYAQIEERTGLEERSQRVARALRKERKQAQRRLDRVESELSEADDVNRLERAGELLKGSLAAVPSGASEFVARDYSTGEEVAIALDPRLSPQENLKAIFKRYQKLVRRLAKAGAQVEGARERLRELDALDAERTALSEEDAEFAAFFERSVVQALLKKHAPKKPSSVEEIKAPKLPAALRGVASRLLPRRYLSHDGLEIWVGRSDEGNDQLSTRIARGNDLFFHLDGAPGSHVVLRTEGRGDPPSDSLLDASELAVHFSKARNATRADVHIVPIKQVSKPKGAKKGLVMVTGGRSLHLRREPARLKRVLDSRIKE